MWSYDVGNGLKEEEKQKYVNSWKNDKHNTVRVEGWIGDSSQDISSCSASMSAVTKDGVV
eukprot:m.260661 g.260661  ORF g.260661 m.260661 type:complete len:60 (-) comp19681_c0_seq23:2815-2994(-)